MSAARAPAQVLDPFVFTIHPEHYPFLAGWYRERPSLLEDLQSARRALEASDRDLRERLRCATLLKACRDVVDAYLDRTGPGPREGGRENRREAVAAALRELCLLTRFLREVKVQAGCRGRPLDRRTREDLAGIIEQHVHLIRPRAVIGSSACTFHEDAVSVEVLGEPVRSRSLCRFYTSRLRSDEEEEYSAYESEGGTRPPPDSCYLFAATIGPGIDEEVERLLGAGENYRALMLNAVGAGAADMVGLDLELWANRERAGPGAWWRRFHTGYGDFRLEEQRRLFHWLDPGRIGIRLNEACVMIPEKSVSGMMALKQGVR